LEGVGENDRDEGKSEYAGNDEHSEPPEYLSSAIIVFRYKQVWNRHCGGSAIGNLDFGVHSKV
jgi:hypothetical protein